MILVPPPPCPYCGEFLCGTIHYEHLLLYFLELRMSERPDEDLENRFTYHRPVGKQVEIYPILRAEAKALAYKIKALTPSSREQSLALTKLEESVFWANAAVARNPETTS